VYEICVIYCVVLSDMFLWCFVAISLRQFVAVIPLFSLSLFADEDWRFFELADQRKVWFKKEIVAERVYIGKGFVPQCSIHRDQAFAAGYDGGILV